MSVIAVLADPPRPGLVLEDLAAATPLSDDQVADLYAAMFSDVVTAVSESGGELLVNYRPDDLLPDEHVTDTDAEADLRALTAEALGGTGDVRFEPQVGSTVGARAGNTVTHLLREEGEDSVAVVPATAPTLARTVVDSAAMKLRRSPVVLGPAPRGRVYYAAFTDTVDFEGAFAPPALTTLAGRAADAGHETDFLQMHPVVERESDLLTLLTLLRARGRADRSLPEFTAACVDSIGLDVVDDDGLRLVVES